MMQMKIVSVAKLITPQLIIITPQIIMGSHCYKINLTSFWDQDNICILLIPDVTTPISQSATPKAPQ